MCSVDARQMAGALEQGAFKQLLSLDFAMAIILAGTQLAMQAGGSACAEFVLLQKVCVDRGIEIEELQCFYHESFA